MKNRQKITVVFLLSLVLTLSTACSAGGEEPGSQSAQVVRADLSVTVDGTGNIEAAREVKLSFGSGGKIKNIYVKEGDEVASGAILAELDKDALELARNQAEVDLAKAEVALAQAQLGLTQAELARKTAEYDLRDARDAENMLELALLNARIGARDAEHHLDETQDIYTWPDIETAQKDVDNAKAYLQYALDRALHQDTIVYAQARLAAAEAVLDAKRNAYDTEEVAIARLQLEAAIMAEAQAQKDLEDFAEDITLQGMAVEAAGESVEQARGSLEYTRQSVQLARQALAHAQKNLDETTITAPFEGVVARVGADEGDTVNSTVTIVHLVDPMSMELIIEVDEVDIPGVRLNQEAIVSVDAISHTTFKGTVTSIYPVATTVSGIVMYNVRINVEVPEDSGLKIGMSATADIVTDKRSDVLLLPGEAVKEDDQGKTIVRVIVDKKAQERAVVTGLSDGSEIEIVSGLAEGETVVW